MKVSCDKLIDLFLVTDFPLFMSKKSFSNARFPLFVMHIINRLQASLCFNFINIYIDSTIVLSSRFVNGFCSLGFFSTLDYVSHVLKHISI